MKCSKCGCNSSHDKKDLLEKLAEVEHEQWVSWAKSLIESEKLSPVRLKRWDLYLVPYSELEEKIKEYDRVWARKVLDIINETS